MNWVINHLFLWGIPYWTGRVYFRTTEDIKELCIGFAIGGLIYVPLCWFEIFFSPKLHLTIYGFFQHSFLQHIRYGGYRPIVFMQHGIMVGVWMALTTWMCFCLWRGKVAAQVFKLPTFYATSILGVTMVACKAMSGMVALLAAVALFYLVRITRSTLPFVLLALSPLLYISSRITGMLPIDTLVSLIEPLDRERAGSLEARMRQEMLYVNQALKSPLFGFGDGDFIPKDESGKNLVRGNDGFWIITTGLYGFSSLIFIFAALAIPSLRASISFSDLQSTQFLYVFALNVVVSLFAVDLLFNSMINPIYLIITGAASSAISVKQSQLSGLRKLSE